VVRIRAATLEPGHPWVGEESDRDWRDTVGIQLAPHEGLSPSQKDVVALDLA
jgi:hypothetical protein